MSRERWRTGNQSSARMQKMKLQRKRKEEKSIIAKIRSRRKKKQMRKREKEELRRGHWKEKGMERVFIIAPKRILGSSGI